MIDIGGTYRFHHERKGVFCAKVLTRIDEFVDVEITQGAPMFLGDLRGVGDVITIRTDFCSKVEALET